MPETILSPLPEIQLPSDRHPRPSSASSGRSWRRRRSRRKTKRSFCWHEKPTARCATPRICSTRPSRIRTDPLPPGAVRGTAGCYSGRRLLRTHAGRARFRRGIRSAGVERVLDGGGDTGEFTQGAARTRALPVGGACVRRPCRRRSVRGRPGAVPRGGARDSRGGPPADVAGGCPTWKRG